MPPWFFYSRSFLPLPPPRGSAIRRFALSARGKGVRLVDYTGDSLSAAEIEVRYPKGDVGAYCLAISSNLFIDSALSRGVGASANASRRGTKPNAKFVIDARSGSARLVTTRCIKAGEEIFVPYGRNYWVAARSCSHSTDGIPDWEWDMSDPFAPVSPPLIPPTTPSTTCPPTIISTSTTCSPPATISTSTTCTPPTTMTPSMDQVTSAPVLAPVVSTVPPSMDCSVAPLTGLALAVAQLIADPSLGPWFRVERLLLMLCLHRRPVK